MRVKLPEFATNRKRADSHSAMQLFSRLAVSQICERLTSLNANLLLGCALVAAIFLSILVSAFGGRVVQPNADVGAVLACV